MRLGIDAREIQDGVFTGIGGPLVNFVRYFARQNNKDTCVLFSARKITLDFGPRVTNRVIPEGITFVWDQWHLPQAIKAEHVDVFYSPYYKIPLLKPCRTISAILDLMYLTFKPYIAQMSPAAKLYYRVMGRWYAHRTDKILTCSQYSAGEIKRYYGVSAEKIEVIPLSVAAHYRQEIKGGAIKGSYLLYVGNFKMHKNVKNLIRGFALIAGQHPHLSLVLAGPREHSYPELLQSAKDLGVAAKVIFLGKITDAEQLQSLYSNAAVFVMPSLYEGFGLPLAEAMACGVPIASSQKTSMPEVVKDACVAIEDPEDAGYIAEAINTILSNEALRKTLINKGLEHAQAYDADTIARRTYDVFKQ